MAKAQKPPTTSFATVDEVATFATHLPENYLLCREMGHNWRPYAASWEGDHYERVIRCSRCKTERVQALSSTGSVLSSHYVYVDGYQHQGLGRISGTGRDRLRLESMIRTVGAVPGSEE